MSNYDVQVVLQGVSNKPEDRYVNTLHFDLKASGGIGDPDFEANADEIFAAYSTILRPNLGGLASGPHSVKIYEPGLNLGGPKFAKDYDFGSPSGSAGPHEVACCLSYATVDDPEASTPRRRGRIYIGPLAGSVTATPRPSSALQSVVLDFGAAIASVGDASLTTWVMHSPRDQAYAKIESIWVDDAWDTQRRRGLEPTARQVRDVQ